MPGTLPNPVSMRSRIKVDGGIVIVHTTCHIPSSVVVFFQYIYLAGGVAKRNIGSGAQAGKRCRWRLSAARSSDDAAGILFFQQVPAESGICFQSNAAFVECRDPQHWRGRCLSLQETEFGQPAVVRRFLPAYEVARVVRMDAIVCFFINLFRFVC